jgi:hypothetical protein
MSYMKYAGVDPAGSAACFLPGGKICRQWVAVIRP